MTKDSSKYKNVKTKDKGVQTAREEKVQIEAEDLTSTGNILKVVFFSSLFAF